MPDMKITSIPSALTNEEGLRTCRRLGLSPDVYARWNNTNVPHVEPLKAPQPSADEDSIAYDGREFVGSSGLWVSQTGHDEESDAVDLR